MLTLSVPDVRQVLLLGAHADDIEIGCGGTVLKLGTQFPNAEFHWVVFSANEIRRKEAESSAEKFLHGAQASKITVLDFRDGFFPYTGAAIKEHFEQLKRKVAPDIVFTHYGRDLHQDHRLLSELTWNTFRNHLILEYEIPKYDGGLGSPNLFFRLTAEQRQRKTELLLTEFVSQADKPWFTAETFDGMMRLRGIECNANSGFAEGFYCRKLCCR